MEYYGLQVDRLAECVGGCVEGEGGRGIGRERGECTTHPREAVAQEQEKLLHGCASGADKAHEAAISGGCEILFMEWQWRI